MKSELLFMIHCIIACIETIWFVFTFHNLISWFYFISKQISAERQSIKSAVGCVVRLNSTPNISNKMWNFPWDTKSICERWSWILYAFNIENNRVRTDQSQITQEWIFFSVNLVQTELYIFAWNLTIRRLPFAYLYHYNNDSHHLCYEYSSMLAAIFHQHKEKRKSNIKRTTDQMQRVASFFTLKKILFAEHIRNQHLVSIAAFLLLIYSDKIKTFFCLIFFAFILHV